MSPLATVLIILFFIAIFEPLLNLVLGLGVFMLAGVLGAFAFVGVPLVLVYFAIKLVGGFL